MKTTTMRWIMAAAALAVAAGSASAQTFKANIPIAFEAAGKTMAPGSYEIKPSALANSNYFVYNRTDNDAIIIIGGVSRDAPKAWVAEGSPRVTFECLDGRCSLKSIYTGNNGTAQTYASPKAPAGDVVAHRIQVVTLTMVKVH